MDIPRCPKIRGSIRSSVLLVFGTSPIMAMCRPERLSVVRLAGCFIPRVWRSTPHMESFLSPTASATGYSLSSPPTFSDDVVQAFKPVENQHTFRRDLGGRLVDAV